MKTNFFQSTSSVIALMGLGVGDLPLLGVPGDRNRSRCHLEFLDTILYRSMRLLFALLGRIPLALRDTLSVHIGRMVFRLAGRHRRIAIANLTLALGSEKSPTQRQMIARKVFENLTRIVFEIGWSQQLIESQLDSFFTISGIDAYQKALAKGKGVLLMTAHFGNWELLPIVAHMVGMPVAIVYRPMDTPCLDRFFNESRSRFGAKTISNRRGAMRQIYRELKQGNVVGLLMDQNVAWYEGTFVDFFNHRACTNTGMATLAVKTQAPVVPFFLIRTPRGFHAVLGPELPLIQTGDRTKDIEANAQLHNDVIERYVRHFPDQWFWVHQRWKTRPMSNWPNPERRNRWLSKQKRSMRR